MSTLLHHRGLTSGNSDREAFDQSYTEDSSTNGFVVDPTNPTGVSRSHKNLFLFLLKVALALVVILALVSSLYWTVGFSTSSHDIIFRGYRRLQEQLVDDLSEIGELYLGDSRFKEVEFCPPEFENYVPCYYNVSENLELRDFDGLFEYERRCGKGMPNNQRCLVLPPKNYRIPLRWPTGRDFIWKENVKIKRHEFSSGSLTKRMMVEEEQISFKSDSFMVDGVEDYSHQIAEMIGLRNESNFNEAGIRTVLDIGCGFGSFGAHLFSKELLTMCIAKYEASGSQVQITLERGLPAMIGSFSSKQLPFPSLSFDMLHCARCGIDWEKNDGIFLFEIDRLLRPGGYFIWTSPTNTQRSLRDKGNQKKWLFIHEFAESLCWDLMSQQDETVMWKKTATKKCYSSRKSGPSVCDKSNDLESSLYQPLNPCIGGSKSQRWIPIEFRTTWPFQASLNSSELDVYGLHPVDFVEDGLKWNAAVHNYWTLLSPLIFSDHPKRPGDEDPSPPFNMVRNVLDMNARFGGFNAALLEAGKSVWVMNVVPLVGPSYLPLILDRGFIGVQHDWCEAFPTYPRTYDMVHAEGLLSVEGHQHHRCSVLDIFLEIDRILRPEGWVIFRDSASLIEAARSVATQVKWDTRVVELDGNNDEKLLFSQKLFFRRQ
ncbi:uncharacterized protein A4U43_C03F18220 [Asparagus officinalis]|uniref:Methyltransferase n=1 Tax=Asparagus officinalis TaxID=4686 RepID=A0A5P1FB42_ASPOF|nr:probable pectin methyltransferase QUA2 [Asparagus officinalis]ONK75565.1 uncharacterized protein A4U43_C03F18220 [Asparagus officinalis]